MRRLKTAIEAWYTWDKQMRANHQIESEKVEKPLIDINVMAALPSQAELERQQKEGKTVIELKAA